MTSFAQATKPLVSLRERVGQFGEHRARSPGEIAKRTGADPAQISRRENGRITPSAARLTESLGASTDYLLVEGIPQRSFRPPKITSAADCSPLANLAIRTTS